MEETNETNYQLWQQELAFLKELRRKQPELFENHQAISSGMLNKFIGIEAITTDLGPGYYRYYPQDFIVEEIMPDNLLCTVKPEKQAKRRPVKKEGLSIAIWSRWVFIPWKRLIV